MYLILVVLTFVLYGQSIQFEYVLDDDLFISNHPLVQEGIGAFADIFSQRSLDYISISAGQQPYRPLTIFSFALAQTMFDSAPGMAHFANIALMAISAILLLQVLFLWFPKIQKDILFLIVMLFVAHPIHTEVVANVKSRDELLNLLFGLMSLMYLWKYDESNKKAYLGYSLLGFSLALLSKESGLTWLFILPLSLYFFKGYGLVESMKKMGLFVFPSATFVGVWFVVNNVEGVLEEPDVINNILFGAESFSELWATKIYIIGKYFLLLLFPINLSWDYSFNQLQLVGFDAMSVWITFLIILGLIYLVISKWKVKSLISFWILFFAITIGLSSNLVIEIGATMAERFLYIPSLAFVFLLVWMMSKGLKIDIEKFSGKNKSIFVIGSIVLFGLYGFQTYDRVGVWENNMVLAKSGVESAPNSARTHFTLAVHTQREAKKTRNPQKQRQLFESSERSFKRSLEIYPQYSNCRYNLGVLYFETGRNELAFNEYLKVVEFHPFHANSLNNLGMILFNKKDYTEAVGYFERVLAIDPFHSDALGNLGAIAHNKGELEKAVGYYERSLDIAPKNAIILSNTVLAFSKLGNVEKANIYQVQLDQLKK
jgi:tetratricopeptide (TPR) repeat protein